MKIDRREFLKTAAVMGMFLPISEVYGSVSQRHVHRGSDACTPDCEISPCFFERGSPSEEHRLPCAAPGENRHPRCPLLVQRPPRASESPSG
jgi:hypothetical protein